MKKLLFCANCGNDLVVPEKRFAVCDCGMTDEYDKDAGFYGELEGETLRRYCGKEYDVTELSNYIEVIPKLRCLPIKNGANIRRELLASLKEEEKLPGMDTLKTWIVLSHVLHIRYSEMYKAFLKNKLYRCCNAVIYSGMSRMAEVNEERLIDGIKRLDPRIPTEDLDYAIDAIADGLSSDVAEVIARAHLDIYDFERILKDTKISVYQAVKDINEFYAIAYRGGDIADLIIEYYDIVRELRDFGSEAVLKFSDDDPIYIRLFMARNTFRIYSENRLYAVRKLLRLYEERKYDEEESPVVVFEEYTARRMTAREVEMTPMIMNLPKTGTINEPPIAILKDGMIEAIFYFKHNGHIVLEGSSRDIHKKVANLYLDRIIPRNEEGKVN